MVKGGESRPRDRIPATVTGRIYFTLDCCKNCNVCLKRPSINDKKRPGMVYIFLKKDGKR